MFRKYEEIYPPDVGEFVYITDDTYTKKQVLRMEHLVLKVLNFDLSVPSTLLFTNLFCKMSECGETAQCLAQVMTGVDEKYRHQYSHSYFAVLERAEPR